MSNKPASSQQPIVSDARMDDRHCQVPAIKPMVKKEDVGHTTFLN